MKDRTVLRGGLLLGAALAAIWVSGTASAGGAKVPQAEAVKSKVALLYDGEIATENTSAREKVFVEIEKIISKDTKNLALKAPEFWVEAVQEGRFANGKRKLGAKKAVKGDDIEFFTRDSKPDDKPLKAKMWYYAGALVSATKPCPLLVTFLEKGMDPKAYIEGTWAANDDVAKNWVVVAMVEGDDFPISKDPGVAMRAFSEIRDRFNTDANRWYLEGVGATCVPVQTTAAQLLSNRLAGLVLRGPQKAVTTTNSALYPTAVVHGKTSAEGAAVFAEYKKIDEKANAEIVLDDLPAVNALNDQVIAWIGQHAKRAVPTTSTFVTTMTDTEGEPWTGCMEITTPAKRGQPTKVTVKYLKDSNTVDIQCENLSEFWLYMNDDLLDLDKEVAVFVNGNQVAKKVFERDLRSMIETADRWGEWGRMFPGKYRGAVASKIEAQPAPPAPPVVPDPNAPPPAKPTDPAPAPAPTPAPPK